MFLGFELFCIFVGGRGYKVLENLWVLGFFFFLRVLEDLRVKEDLCEIAGGDIGFMHFDGFECFSGLKDYSCFIIFG